MSLFIKIFNRVLAEDIGMTSGGADSVFGAGGSTGGSFPGGSDFYAPGDARLPVILGAKPPKKRKRKGKKRKKLKNKNKVKELYTPVIRRNIAT